VIFQLWPPLSFIESASVSIRSFGIEEGQTIMEIRKGGAGQTQGNKGIRNIRKQLALPFYSEPRMWLWASGSPRSELPYLNYLAVWLVGVWLELGPGLGQGRPKQVADIH